MRTFVLVLFGLLSGNAFADLYRWVDPETRSVKFSSYPPPWYGDAEKEKRAPKVERIPERKTGATPPAPGAPAAAAQASAQGATLESLEARRKRLIQQLASPQPELQGGGTALKERLEAFAAVNAQMDRLDPRGTDRRRIEAQPVLEKLVDNLRTQIKSPPR